MENEWERTSTPTRGGLEDSLEATMVADGPPPEAEPVPQQVGRYHVQGIVGRGAMGVVLRAHDPRLDRTVALKLLHASVRAGDEVAQRLRREGQALAKLSHPNVVDVYDVGEHEQRVFIAMELVWGQTLGHWLRTHPPRPEVLDAFVQAADGLDAAHAAGLVHRDFKPANVLRGDDGRVRVVDFGLVIPVGGVEHDPTLGTTGEEPADVRMTATGHVVGTPAYMAPEVQCGAPANAHSDQFSFCVALFEALYGQRPFPGNTYEALLRRASRGEVEFPAGVIVPPWLRRAVVRGLSPEPHDRWPSLGALASRLRHRPSRRAWPWIGLVAITGALGGSAWLATSATDPGCDPAAQSVRESWDEATREGVHAAFVAAGPSYAEITWQRVSEVLDARVEALAEARREVCEATRTAAEDPGELDRRRVCLGRRHAALRGAIAVLEHADGDVVRHAMTVVARLRAAEPCDQDERSPAPPPDAAESIDRAREDLARLDAMVSAQQLEPAKELGRELVARTTELAHPPLLARARYVHARALELDGDYERAATEMNEVWTLARAEGLDAMAAEVSTQLIYVVGRELHRPEEAERWVRHARAAIERLDEPGDAETFLESTLGNYHLGRGEIDRAQRHFAHALRIHEQTLGPRHPRTMLTRINLALAHRGAGELERAKALMEQTLGDRIEVLGPGHPSVAATYGNLAVVEQELGDFEASVAHNMEALELTEAALGSEHPSYASMLMNLANTEYLRGELEAALELHKETRALLVRTVGPRSLLEGRTLMNIGAMYTDLERYEEARTASRQALEILEENRRPGHPELAGAIQNVALIEHRAGRLDAALAGYDRALEILEATEGGDPTLLARAMQGRAAVLADLERLPEALLEQRRAVDRAEQAEGAPSTRASARFELAKLLERQGERAEAREQVATALAMIEDDESAAELADAMRAWSSEHPARSRP